MTDAMSIPAAVKEAVEAFSPDAESGFTVVPPKPGQSSVLYNWGVRVSYKNAKTNADEIGWICLGSQTCRDNWTLYPLYGGKTSNGTKHLKEVHQVASEKMQAEVNRKRTIEEEVEELRSSQMTRQDPKRMRLLLETRDIIIENRPFCSGESSDKQIMNELVVAEEFRTSVNTKAVCRSIIEIYVATRREVMRLLKLRPQGVRTISLVFDFWTCKTQHNKYLGVRAYFIDKDWKFRSVLLGIRLFNPTCAARTKNGFRGCFKLWMEGLLDHFEIQMSEVFGGMTDGAGDVKRLVREDMKAAWEWCIPHMMNCATKWACGLTDNVKDSVNPELTDLVERLRTTIRQVRDVEQMGTLFAATCDNLVKIVKYSCLQKSTNFLQCERIGNMVKDQVIARTRQLMRDVQAGASAQLLEELDRSFQQQMAGELSAELADLYGSVSSSTAVDCGGMQDAQVEDEIHRWMSKRAVEVSSPLEYWKREEAHFPLLSRAAKTVFGFPSSSAQIERDFGDTGRMVTKERASLKRHNIEMSSFVRANSNFVRLAQCDKIPVEELSSHIPTFMIDDDDGEALPRIFSERCSVDESEQVNGF